MDVHHLALIAVFAACNHGPDGSPTGSTGSDPGPEPDAIAAGPVRAHVGEPAVLDGSASTGTAFRWTTSTGQVVDDARAEVVFDAPGHYSAVLEARDALGRTDTDSVPVTVTWPRADTAPVAGSSVVTDGDHLYVALTAFDQVADVVGDAVARWIPTCDGPRSVAVGHGALWVACDGDDTVVRHDLGDDDAVPVPLGWGSRPFAVVARPDDVLVTLQGAGAVAVLDPDGGIDRVVPALPDVRGLAASADRVVVTRYRSPDDAGVALVFDRDLADPVTVAIRVDPGPDSDTNSRGVPNLLQRPVIRPDARVVVIPGSKANLERGLYRDGLPLTFETTVRADLRALALDPAEGAVGDELGAALFDDRDQALAAAYSPDGDWLFVLHTGMETVDVLDAYTLERAGAAQDVGALPTGLAVSADGARLWVVGGGSRTLKAYDLASIAIPAPVATIDLVPPGGEVVDPQVLAGELLFGRSIDPRICTAGYLSCASCHPEGDHDGRTWDFTDRGEGLRNTISLVGRAGAAPIHWSANFDEVQDFENDIRGPMAGTGFLTDDQFAATSDTLGAPKAGLSPELDALAAYVVALDAPPRAFGRGPDGAPTAGFLAGEQVFLDPAVGCATCHPAPVYSDNGSHDVGTGAALAGLRSCWNASS
ncbi:MAG: hypothetical protein ABMB14_30625 [Myxococcota bacterium]